MTSFLNLEYLIYVSTGRRANLHWIVPVPGWRPDLLDTSDRELVGFTDDLTGTTITVDVSSEDGTVLGYLMPTAGRCALCHNQRHITVHSQSEHAPHGDDDGSTVAFYDPDHDAYSIYTRRPCPACRYLNDELSGNDHSADAEDPS